MKFYFRRALVTEYEVEAKSINDAIELMYLEYTKHEKLAKRQLSWYKKYSGGMYELITKRRLP